MNENRKELTMVQRYAVERATETVKSVQQELQSLLIEVAKEHGINISDPREQWKITEDNKYLIRQGIVPEPAMNESKPKLKTVKKKDKINKK